MIHRTRGMGGVFSTALNVVGAYAAGDPALGSRIAAQASPAWTAIKEDPDQIAARVSPGVVAALNAGAVPNAANISAQAEQVAAGVAPNLARQLAAQGVFFPAGTVGAELQKPSALNAFGGEHAQWVMAGGLALGALLLIKGLRS